MRQEVQGVAIAATLLVGSTANPGEVAVVSAAPTTSTPHAEAIHTTANHTWLVGALAGAVAGVIGPEVSGMLGAEGAGSFAAGIGGEAVGGGVGNGVGQVADNLLSGRPWDANLGQSVVQGAVTGGIVGAVFSGGGSALEAADSSAASSIEQVSRDGANGLNPSAVADETAAATEAGSAGVCSFAATTAVATPSGAQTIGSLHVGDAVVAYSATTGKDRWP